MCVYIYIYIYIYIYTMALSQRYRLGIRFSQRQDMPILSHQDDG